ncbi:MAG: alkaline phosphatase family protein, partial [Cyclobacteriaceae bacterium]
AFLLLWGITSCTSPTSPRKKVLIVHARGISYPDLIGYLRANGSSGYLNETQSNGTLKKLRPITNAVTISNIASFETGLQPSNHGVIGHNFGVFKEGQLTTVNGFSKRYLHETFWEKADRNGLRVLNVGALAMHGKFAKHKNVDCLAQGSQMSQSKFLILIPSSNLPDETGNVLYKSTGNQNTIRLTDKLDPIRVYKKNLEATTLIIDTDLSTKNGIIGELTKGNWVEITTGNRNGLSESLRLKWTATHGDSLELYVRGSFVNRGYPSEFLRKIDTVVGPSKGWPNIPLYSNGHISEYVLIEEINAELDYVMDVFSVSAKDKNYDLIMLDYPLMDRYGHAFLQLKNSFSQHEQYYQDAFDRMNRDFSELSQFAAENNYELVIASSHGFSPIHTSINMNKVLRDKGIVTDSKDWQARAIPGKVSSHIYINPELGNSEQKAVERKIISLLDKLTLTENGEIVTDKIYRKENLDEIGLLSEHAGDIFILLKPGYVFSSDETLPILSVPDFKGDHGYSLDHEDSFGFIISNEECDPCLTTDIAGLIAQKLKIN